MKQGEWLFENNKHDRLRVDVICSCCKARLEGEFKYLIVTHQDNFKRENPYCRKCGAKMG